MQTIVHTLALTLGLALIAGGCSKREDACGTLADKIAEAAGVTKDKIAAAVDKELTGPSGEALKGDQREAVCKMILSDKAALEGYIATITSQRGT